MNDKKSNDNWYSKFQEKERVNEKKCNKQQNSSYEVYLVINVELNSYVAKIESSEKRNTFLASAMNHAAQQKKTKWLTKSQRGLSKSISFNVLQVF